MLPPLLAPTLKGPDSEVVPSICRLSPDGTRLAFWVEQGDARGLYVGEVEWAEEIGDAAERVWQPESADVTELAWSGDGVFLAMRLAGDSPRLGVLKLDGREFSELPGHSFAWAGRGATLLVADPASARLYMRDMDLGVEHRICEITDDGDPRLPPVISVSPDQRRFALVTRRAAEDATRVHLAHHDGRDWRATPVTQVAGVGLTLLPFWSPDSTACGLYVIDPEQHHTVMIAVPDVEGAGDILYTSDTVDGVVTPAVHPDGRLIAFIRAHARPDAPSLVENRLVLLDPVEHAVAPITESADIVGHLRWVDDQTLLVEGGPAVWTVKLRATAEAAPATAAAAPRATVESSPAADSEAFVRTVVDDAEPSVAFSFNLPAGWQRSPLPPLDVDFSDPQVMRPLCLFGPAYATMFFAVAWRPLVPSASPADMLASLARGQGFDVGEVRPIHHPAGPAAETDGTQRSGDHVTRARFVFIEDGGRLFSLAGIAPAPLWPVARRMLESAVDSFRLLEPRGSKVDDVD
jgi:hypothetical protein